MRRSVLTSLTMVSLAMIVAPGSAQQPSPATGARAQPVGVIRQEDCPKVIGEINAAAGVRFDPAAASARQAVLDANKLQADGKYAECFSRAQATRDALIASGPSPAVYPDYDDPRLWAHPDEDSGWVRRPQRP
jgi:hypothetical protein